MTPRNFFLLFLMYCTFLANTVGAVDFDSNVFIFWTKRNMTAQNRVKIDHFFCMGVALHTKWVLTSRICFEDKKQLSQPENFAVVPILNQNEFNEKQIKNFQILEVKEILLNITQNKNNGIVILLLKNENTLARNITTFISSSKLQNNASCKTLMWAKIRKRYDNILQPRIFNATLTDTEHCITLVKGDACITSNITGRLCKPVRSSLLQCQNHIYGFSGHKIPQNVCQRPNSQLSQVYIDFSENILHIVIFLLTSKENEASCLISSKVLMLTVMIIAIYR